MKDTKGRFHLGISPGVTAHIKIFPVTMTALTEENPAMLIQTLRLPNEMAVIIPIEDSNVAIAKNILDQYFLSAGTLNGPIPVETVAETAERIHSLGDAPLQMIVTIGDQLNGNGPEASQAARRILNLAAAYQEAY